MGRPLLPGALWLKDLGFMGVMGVAGVGVGGSASEAAGAEAAPFLAAAAWRGVSVGSQGGLGGCY